MKRLALFLLFAVPALAQVVPFRTPRVTFTTATGQPLSGGCVFTYQGGTSTPQATYADYTGTTPNANPVILDTTGSAVMWLGINTYKFVAYSNGGSNCALGSLQWTVDQVPGDAFLNGTISGATITNPTIQNGTQTGTAIAGVVVTGSNIQGTPVGTETPAAGNFTSLASTIQAVSFSATPVFNAASYGYFSITLTGNVTSSTITGGQNGQQITINVCQNATGGYTFAWPANLIPNQGVPSASLPVVSPVANSCTILTAINNSVDWVVQYDNASLVQGGLQLISTASPTMNAAAYSNFGLYSLTGNVASSTISGGTIGQVINIQLCQDGTGGRTFAWPASFVDAPVVNPAANSCTGVLAVSTGNPQWTVFQSTTTNNVLGLTGTTGPITGTSLSATCDSGTVAITGAPVGHPVSVSSTTGADVGGAFDLRGSVTSAGVVTVYVCGTGTPATLSYNVTVL